MKKIIALVSLFICVLVQTQAQPTLDLIPGTNKITLKGNSGGFVTNPTHYEVYRGTAANPETLYTTFQDGANYTWEDQNVIDGTFYYYRIKARDDNAGTITNFSDEERAKTVRGQGNHYVFDGVDDRLTLFNSSLFGLRGSTALNSIRFWVKIDELPSGKDMEILRITETSVPNNNNSLRIYHNSNKLIVLFSRDDYYAPNNSVQIHTAPTKNIADGKWHKVVINKFGQEGTAVFVDGQGFTLLYNNRPTQASYDFGLHLMIIGGQDNASTTFFKGAIDNLKLFNGNNLRHHWKFDEFESTSKAFNSVAANPNLNKENGVSSAATSPFGPVTTVSKADEVSVRWNKDVDLPDEVLESYQVWRKEGDGSLQFLANVVKEDTAYVDQTVTTGTTYEYEVRSIKSNNVVVRSETDLAKPVAGFDRHLVVNGAGEVQVPDSDLFPDNNGTIEFWMRTNDSNVGIGKSHSVVNKHDQVGSQNGFNFILDRSTLYVQVKDNGVTNRTIRPTTPIRLNDDTWHHVAFAYEWGGVSTLYIDGVARVTENNTPDVTLTSEPFRIGRSPASFWDPFIGRIDEVYVWDKVLTGTEIANQMNQRIPGDTEGLSGVWRFDLSNTNETAFEDGVNEFDGTVVGGLKNQIVERTHVATSYNGSQVDLEWDFQLNENITSYQVSREDLSLATNPTILATLSNTATTYTDLTAQENVFYQYLIRAITDDSPRIGTDEIITRKDLGNMLDFGSMGGSVEIDEEVTDNQTGTIEFRFRSEVDPPTGKSYSLLNRHDNQGSDNGFNFVLSKGTILVQFKESLAVTNLSHNANLIDGEWHHVALVYDYSGTNTLYVDGAEVGSATLSGLEITSEPTRIGSSVNAFWEDYEGQVDELRMWTKQLTTAEINASKNIRLPGNTPDLGAVWHFDGSGGTFALDNGSNNYDGRLADDVQFYQEPGVLTFSSSSNGFMETSGNNGKISGQMTITIEGNSFKNPASVINNNQFVIENKIQVSDPMNTVFEKLTTGLDPILVVNPDGKSANLTFNGEAVYHINEYSTTSLSISLNPAVFADDNPVINSQNAVTNISYFLRDNILPTLIEPIPDVQLLVTSEPTQIELDTYFTDPDFEQQFQYLINKDNSFVSSSLNGSILTVGVPESPGEGSTEFTVTFIDNNGGEVSDVFVVSVVKLDQVITFPPIPDIDLATQNTVPLTAIANSNLPVELELLSGDGVINNGVLTVNQSGTFQVSANQAGDDTFAPAEEVIQSFNVIDSRKDSQTITFTDDLSGLTYGNATVNLTATASSNLDVSYNSTGPVQVNGSTVTITGAGAASVTAIQVGDGDYNPADPVTISFTIAKADLIVRADDKTRAYNEANPEFTITYDGFVGQDLDESVLDELPEAETSATIDSDAGTYSIMISGGSDNNYAFSPVNGALTIGKADQTITFSEINDRDIATSSTVTLNASASSGLAVGYDLEGNGRIDGNTITLERTGTFVVTAIQSGNNNYNEAPRVTRTFLVTNSQKTDQTITFETIPDQEYGNEFTLEASASSNLAIDYRVISGLASINNGVLTLLGVGTVEIQAAQDGDDTFNPAQAVTRQFSVGKAPLTVTADGKTIQAGQAIPDLTFTYSGFRLNNDASFVDTPPTISTEATTSSPEGTYAITLTGGEDFVYELILVNGTLTIESVLSVDEAGLIIYPNPVVDRLQVKGREIKTMHLLSPDGKLIRSRNANTMDVSDVEQGNYILQLLERDGQVSNYRVMKK